MKNTIQSDKTIPKKVLLLTSMILLFFVGCKEEKVETKQVTKQPKEWIVNGHRLPPEPDPTLNNSTLLGIDSNDNGVRDDVERWVYDYYKDVHPVNIAVAMQAARAYQILMEDPVKAAKELHSEMSAPLYCEFYYANDAKYFGEEILIPKDINTKTFRQGLIFNTDERKNAYYIYNATLSGGAYTLPKSEELKAFCDDAVREVMK